MGNFCSRHEKKRDYNNKHKKDGGFQAIHASKVSATKYRDDGGARDGNMVFMTAAIATTPVDTTSGGYHGHHGGDSGGHGSGGGDGGGGGGCGGGGCGGGCGG
ncbi:hypothetical protein L195_g028824 [Trifolium pratense]|uniref:Uncharacterized protein n=2 Tax=Trifolium pratense TaxID=57577 RepID=A0ACB0LMN4_TRIPR|nr:cold shock protein 2-like [Trifolium pratense]PNX72926.1 hypothetical protein L195_g028824 [Trifolium pratense]CAJ2670511.1 unnamed protein product [Trifolium pratense]